jgi:hypothetical protein
LITSPHLISVRFTVHYNLCVGTIVGLGSDEQIKAVQEWQVC